MSVGQLGKQGGEGQEVNKECIVKSVTTLGNGSLNLVVDFGQQCQI